MLTKKPGETVTITCTSADPDSGAADSPDTSMKIKIKDPHNDLLVLTGSAVIDDMTEGGAGDYSYKYALAADALSGLYEWECVADNDPEVTIAAGQFKVIPRVT